MREPNAPAILGIFATVAEEYGYSLDEILKPNRWQPLPMIRAVGCYVADRHGFSLSAIGRAIGRDHSTVHYGRGQIRGAVNADRKFATYLDELVELTRPVPPAAGIRSR